MSKPRIAIADDHRVFAEGLRALLEPHAEIVGIVEDGAALVELVEEECPDVVLTDVSMPGLNGFECLRRLRGLDPDLRVILLTMHEDASMATMAMREGADAFLLKHGGVDDVVAAVLAKDDAPRVSPQLAEAVDHALETGTTPASHLTERQQEIVRLLAEGLLAKEIAARLDLSRRTVEYHKYQAMERLGLGSSAELVTWALKHGIGPV